MLTVGKFVLQTRTLCLSCIPRLHQYPSHLKITKWLIISQQAKHPTWPPHPVSTRCLRIKSGDNHALHLQHMHKWDNVPGSYSLIYESGLKNYVYGLYTTVALFGVATGSLVAVKWQTFMEKITDLESLYPLGMMPISILVLAIVYRFARTVIIRIYHDTDSGQFVAIRRTCLGRLKQIVYKPQEVTVKQGGKLTNQDIAQTADIRINGRDYFISASGFRSPVFYNIHVSGDDLSHDVRKSFVSGPKF